MQTIAKKIKMTKKMITVYKNDKNDSGQPGDVMTP